MNGRLFLRAGVRDGRTVLVACEGTFPLQVVRPHAASGCGISLVLLLSGGLLDGDEVSLDVIVESGAHLVLRTQAATQVHVGRSRQAIRATVGEDAWLSYVPHALVPHADADFYSQTVIEMQPSARVLLAETLSAGRLQFGEQFAFKQVRLDLDVWRDGALVARERSVVQPDQGVRAAQFGVATHTAAIYVLGDSAEPTHDLGCGDALVGCSALARGGWYVRALANRASTLDTVLQRLHQSWVAR